jgi:hypothetical protein
MLQQQTEHQATLRTTAMCGCEENKGSGAYRTDERQSRMTVTAHHRRSADHAPSQGYLLCIPGQKAPEDFCRSVLSGTHPSQQIGSDQRRPSRSYPPRGGLGDPSCGRGCCGPQLVENAPRDHEPFRVFTGVQPDPLRQLDVIPVAFSALSRSFLVLLLFIPSLQYRSR